MAISEKLIDKRIVARNIKKGLITSDAYQQLLAELPDRADNIYKPEETDHPEASTVEGEAASSEIQTTEPLAAQTTSEESHQPRVEPRAISGVQQPTPIEPAPSLGTTEPASNQPQSQPDTNKPPSNQE